MARASGSRLARIGTTALAVTAITVASYCADGALAAATAVAAPAATAVTAATTVTAAATYTPPSRDLAPGMKGADVKAFQEINGITPTGVVGPATKRALVHPRTYYSPRYAGKRATRVEVSQALEVLVLFKNNKIELISHVSSGGGYYYDCGRSGCARAVTPNGLYNTTRYLPGWVTVPLGEMYNPVFFIGTAYAIHGDTYVPVGPASHGCVRVPMDIANFFHTLVTTPGTQVYVYGTPQWEK